jgi:GNAT superfamily N-acetyltransferase
MNYRIAIKKDFLQLANLRWDFKLEGKTLSDINNHKDEFLNECVEFFTTSDEMNLWTHWIAEENEEIVSHISINHIRKIPKPNLFVDHYAYVTNVYTKPEYRGKGTGSLLMDYVVEWATEKSFELLIVWPSSKAINFYSRKGFKSENDVMELIIRPEME